MINGVAYARFSSDNQREESIDAQVRAIQYYAQSFGINIVHVYADRAKTGKYDDRPEFLKMISDSESGRFDVVLVHKLDRFSRNPADTNYYERVLNQNGVKLISVIEKLDESPEGQLMKQIIIGMNAFYSANLAREVRKGLKETALQGKFTGGVAPFGYVIKDGKYEIDEKNADAVIRAFEMYLQGYGVLKIAKTLNEEGYRSTRGNYLAPRTIAGMLKNPKYIGQYTYKLGDEEITVDDAIPQIVPHDLWLRVQEERKNPHRMKHKEQKRNYLLTGKMFCVCGGTFSGGSMKRTKHGAEYYYYLCYKKKIQECPHNSKGVNKDYIEKLVIDEIAEKILSDEMIDKISNEAVMLSNAEKEKPKVSIQELEKKQKDIKNKQNRLADLYLDGGIERDILDEKSSALNDELKIIQSEIRKAIQLENSPTLQKNDFVEYIKSYRLDASTEDVARILIDTFVEKIIVHNDKIEIVFKVDFDVIGGGEYKRKSFGFFEHSAGAICSLPPMVYTYSYPRRHDPVRNVDTGRFSERGYDGYSKGYR